jgi:lipopolysaccharide export system permease protein
MYAAFALPLSMFVTRRPHGATMAVTIVLAILSVLLSSVSLALGESGNIAPFLAAWLPIVLFAALGVWLMRRRVRGRALWPIIG